MGGNGAQDGTVDSDDEEQSTNSDVLESSVLDTSSTLGSRERFCPAQCRIGVVG